MFYAFKPHVSAAERRRKAGKAMAKLKKNGHPVAPVVIDGRVIAKTFWGKSWCDNLERYGDYANRLPRGRTYARNGSVVDLQIDSGAVRALVSGSELYEVEVNISAVPKPRWSSLCRDCAGSIDSLVELLQGQLSRGVMERMCRQGTGLFPAPKEITFTCSCPDWASMCKHVAAVLYGIGARLDERPALLFALRSVDEKDLVAKAGTGMRVKTKPKSRKLLQAENLSDVFGIEIAQEPKQQGAAPNGRGKRKAPRTRRKKR